LKGRRKLTAAGDAGGCGLKNSDAERGAGCEGLRPWKFMAGLGFIVLLCSADFCSLFSSFPAFLLSFFALYLCLVLIDGGHGREHGLGHLFVGGFDLWLVVFELVRGRATMVRP
jgi:hypothetical protein